MNKSVTNATVLILLAKIGKLELLDIFNNIFTTSTISDEVLKGKNIPKKERKDLKYFFSKKLKLVEPKELLDLSLGFGETSALSLCKEQKINYFLSDDKKARNTAEILSIKSIGTLGILILNLKKKKINKNEAKKILNLLVSHAYYISTDVYSKALEIMELE